MSPYARDTGARTTWGRTASWTPARVVHPASTPEVCEVVRDAAGAGSTVRAVGSGHSFTPAAATEGVQLVLDKMAGIERVDREQHRVTVGAGTTLRALNPALHRLGLALPNLGDVDAQTVAGAVATGTHGTGGRLRGLAEAVVGMDLVDGGGEVVRVDATSTRVPLEAARVGLGALGVACTVTLRCVPAFWLHAYEAPMRLPDVLEQTEDLVAANDHFEFYWFPHTDRTLTKRNNRVGPEAVRRPLGRGRELVEDELLSNGAFELINRVAARRRAWVPRLNQVSARALPTRTYVDDSYRVFVSPRRVRFAEMEYAVPRASLAPCLREIGAWLRARDETVSFPVEVRFAAADGAWLSTAHGRDTAYIAVHQYHRIDRGPYFAAVEEVVRAAGGRPHWGKLHTLDADALAALYPRFADFVAVRDRLDPARTFANAYLERVLG